MVKYIIPFSFLLVIGLFSCNQGERVLSDNIEEIEEYLAENNLTAERTEDDLFYIIEEEGMGDFPDINDEVEVDYHGYFLDGTVFDSSIDGGSSITLPLSRVIRGWQLGIPLFKRGGKGVLLVPSHLAYGEEGTRGIPSNSVLIFDINLIDF